MSPPGRRMADTVALVDQSVAAAERRWGIGRLRLLVAEATRSRFDSADQLWRACFLAAQAEHNPPGPHLPRLEELAAMMQRAWAAMDAEATAAGAAQLDPEWWEVQPDEDGRGVVCITRTLIDAQALAARAKAEGRLVEVWSLEEVARVLAGTGIVAAIKAGFPGATVERSSRLVPEGRQLARRPCDYDEIPDFGGGPENVVVEDS